MEWKLKSFLHMETKSFVGKTKVQQNGRYTVFSQAQQRLMKTRLKFLQIQSDPIPFLFTQILPTFSAPFPLNERNAALCIMACWMTQALLHVMKALLVFYAPPPSLFAY